MSSYGPNVAVRPEDVPARLPNKSDAYWYELGKRLLDVVAATAILVLLSPLWLAIALVIKLSSPGPILFRADAVGLRGRPFWCLKFRTMRSDADDSHHRAWIENYVKQNQPYMIYRDELGVERPVYKVINDPRVTPIGRLLRKTGLDEVPQLVNVLRGEMSIVGPRPPRAFEYAHYGDHQRRRLSVPPGITGLYQVTARSQASFDEMLMLDLEYIARRSLWFDLQIMVRTVPVMVLGRGGF